MSDRRTVHCYVCGKEFPIRKASSRYCSDTCRLTVVTSAAKLISCIECGVEFNQHTSLAKYCSAPCRERYRAKKKARPLAPLKPCLICSVEFKPVNGSHRYCSPECNRTALRKRVNQARQSPESKLQVSEYNKKYHKEVRYTSQRDLKDANLQRVYGLSIDEYDSMWDEQKGLCAICKKPPPGNKPLCVDHCHVSGKVRKLLCVKCNSLIGNCDEQLHILDKAKEYLISHHALHGVNIQEMTSNE